MTDHTQLRQAAEAATPGPWYVQYGDDATHMCMTAISPENKRERNMGQFVDGQPLIAITLHQSFPHVDPDCENDEANSAFIAAANPQAVIELLDENERLRKDAERYRWLRDKCQDEDVRAFFSFYDESYIDAAMRSNPGKDV